MNTLPVEQPGLAAFSLPDLGNLPRQYAALCTRKGKRGREVLLVTSSRGRWILPKGWEISGLAPHETAMTEAWEEAGVRKGRVGKHPVARFHGCKTYDDGTEQYCDTSVYAVRVHDMRKTYPEVRRRRRVWVTPKKALTMVDDPGLIALLRQL